MYFLPPLQLILKPRKNKSFSSPFIVGVSENVCVVTSVWSADCVHELCSQVYDESWADNFPIFGPCYDLADPPQFHRPHIDLTCPT